MMQWFRKLFGDRRSSVREAESPSDAPRAVSFTGDAYYGANSDIIDGVQFSATLQLRTPLSVLNRHGEVFRGPPSQAPDYGGQAHGIWLPKLKSDSLEEMLSQGRTHASDAGQVVDVEYLPFLKAFRGVFEGSGTVMEKLRDVRQLPKTSTTFAAYWRQLSKNIPDFPASLFYLPLTEIDGVGRTTAKRLFEAGFHSLEALVAASDAELMAVKGVGKSAVAKIRAFAPAPGAGPGSN